ncbi:hypothetical protein [Thermospira aquatica]|uniref:Tetratricopeptide repeat protein n=1 Tax=Thermospira aquatica TaxID=2828656 RepID=A0AAX3BFK3_9SPIR|nr:hypothetical protein [Thermospira aquatica]URA10908.1 hypothetical protein KDW03_03655 [Thermospira aquatica]
MERKWIATFALSISIFAVIVAFFLWSEGYFRFLSSEGVGLSPISSLFSRSVSKSSSGEVEALVEVSSGQEENASFFEMQTNVMDITHEARYPQEVEVNLFREIQTAYDLQQYDRVFEKATSYLSSYPEGGYRFPILHLVSATLYKQRRLQEALQWCRQAIAEGIPAEYERVFASLVGYILKDSEVFDPALLGWMEQVYLRHPQDVSELVIGIAYQYLYKDEPKTALRYLQEAQGELAIIGRARAYLALANYPAVIQEYENFFAFYPASPRKEGVKLAFLRQTFYYAQRIASESPGVALEYYAKLFRFVDSNEAEEAFLQSVRLLHQMKKYDKALALSSQGLSNRNLSKDPDILLEKANILYEINQKHDALSTYQDFLMRYPSHLRAQEAKDWMTLISKELSLE